MNERYRPDVVIGTVQPTSNCELTDLDALTDALEDTEYDLRFGEPNDSGVPTARIVRPVK